MASDTTSKWLYQLLVVSLVGSLAPLAAQESGQAELVGQGTVSSDRGDTFPAVSPDGQLLYFLFINEQGFYL